MEDEITETLPWTARFEVGDWIAIESDYGQVVSVSTEPDRLTVRWERRNLREHSFLDAEVFSTKEAAKAYFESFRF